MSKKSSTFESTRLRHERLLDDYLDRLDNDRVNVRALIGAVVIESGPDHRQQVFSIEDGVANPETIMNAAACFHRHMCRLLCITSGRDPQNPRDMTEAHAMIMGYLHQREDDITGVLISPILTIRQ